MIGVELDGRVCILTLQREEKLNALSAELERGLGHALDGEAARASRCIILTGAGRAFSAGADINEFRDRTPDAIAAYYHDTGNV